MYPILYDSITLGTVPQHNGLGVLSDCISCSCEHARNDIYELTFEYPMSGIHAQDLSYMRFVKAKPNPTDDPQLFFIARIGKVMNGKFTVYCKHISYLLSGFDIVSGTANNAAAACTLLQNASTGFTITTDKVVNASFNINTPASVKSYFVGRKGSFLDVFGKADIKYDNFRVQFLTNAGADRGVTINYGKNLLELTQEIDSSNLYTHVRCYYQNGEDEAVVGNKVATGLSLPSNKCLVVDVSSEYQEAPSVSQLTTRAQKYINDNNLTTPTNNIKLDFVQSGELANRVDLCDTVTVFYEALGITRTGMKCIRVKYDVIKEKYIETEFGDAQTSAVDTIAFTSQEIANKPNASFMAEAIAHATELITGNLGGYVVLHDANGDGEPDEILIMDTADINTATKVWRWNKNGLGYSSSGYAGTFGTAITADGKIVADYIATGTLDASKISVQHLSASSIDAGTLDANLIKAGTISDMQGNSSINMTNGVAKMKNLDALYRMRLLNSDGTTVKAVLVHNIGTGVNFTLYNDAGVDCGGLSTSQTGGGIYLKNNEGSLVVYGGRNESNNNGILSVYNRFNKVIFSASADSDDDAYVSIANRDGGRNAIIGVGYYRGYLHLKNTQGKTVIDATASPTADDGTINVTNSSGTTTITLSGQSGNVRCVSLTQTSSRKVKENIKPIADAEKILDLEAVSFDYKEKATGTDKRGFIAEDVAKILPNLVTPETEDAPACLDYIGMIPYLQDVIKKQEARIQALEERLDALESK